MATRWLTGERRVSQRYMVRLNRLLRMKLEGTDFSLIKSIDWQDGVVVHEKERLRLSPSNNVLSAFMDQRPR